MNEAQSQHSSRYVYDQPRRPILGGRSKAFQNLAQMKCRYHSDRRKKSRANARPFPNHAAQQLFLVVDVSTRSLLAAGIRRGDRHRTRFTVRRNDDLPDKRNLAILFIG